MKKNSLIEIKKMDINSLKGKAKTVYNELEDLLLNKSINKITNSKLVRSKKKDLAQVLTILRQKELIKQLEGEKNA